MKNDMNKSDACPTCGGVCPDCGASMESENENAEDTQEQADLQTMVSKEVNRRFAGKGK